LFDGLCKTKEIICGKDYAKNKIGVSADAWTVSFPSGCSTVLRLVTSGINSRRNHFDNLPKTKKPTNFKSLWGLNIYKDRLS